MVNMRSILAATLLGGVAELASAQQWQGTYTDKNTGITYQAYQNSAFGGFTFGMALPTNPTNEFIGLLEGPLPSSAPSKWSGISLGGSMNGPLLVLGWANGKSIVTSFRIASNYVEPFPSSNPNGATLTQLNAVVNSTHWSLTFRCQNCNTWPSGSVDYTGDFAFFGFAQGTASVSTPSSTDTHIPPHDSNFANFGLSYTDMRNANYATWLAKYSGSTSTTTKGPTSTTAIATTTTSKTTTTSAGPLPTYTKSYDYIIVGSGAGGQIIADRLSEAGKSVLLIERGPPSTYQHGGRIQPPWVGSQSLTRFDIPGLCNEIWHNASGIACTDIDGGVMAGCVLGGGTAINSGLWWRPQPADYNTDWPVGWQYNDVIASANKLFQRIPGTTTPSQDGVRYGQDLYNLMSSVLGGKGWQAVDANNQPTLKNRTYGHTPYMYSGGQRAGPLATYLVSAKARGNFQLAMYTSVVKLVRNGGTVTGVVTEATGPSGLRYFIPVTSSGRVILSAGVFNTAKILFRSGIGPTDVLNTVKSSDDGPSMIASTSWINLPVGYNLHDQDNTDVVFSHPSISPYDFYGAYLNPIPADRDKYLNSRAGQLAEAAPNCNTVFFERFAGTDGRTRQAQWTARKEPSLGFSGDTMVTLSLYLTNGMTSRGRLTILPSLSTTVSTLPYLNTQEDIDAKVKAIQSWIDSAKNYPDLAFQAPAANQTAKDYVAKYLGGHGSNHWMGTCKLGYDDGTKGGSAVVDVNAQVYGTTNLFVVDASIFPGTTTANPSAFIMSVAELASQKILALALGAKAGAGNPVVSSTTSSSSVVIKTTTSSSTTTTSSLVKTTTTSSTVPVTTTKSTTTTTPVRTTTTSSTTSSAATPAQTLWGQCGGAAGYNGPTTCVPPATCKVLNPYYSQCLNN